jgi:hypothetical protein
MKVGNNSRVQKLKTMKMHSYLDMQVSAKKGTASDGVIKEQRKLIGQQMSVTNFVCKNWYVVCTRK